MAIPTRSCTHKHFKLVKRKQDEKCPLMGIVNSKMFLKKCKVGEVSGQVSVWSGKCPVREVPRSGKCPFREVSGQGSVRSGKCPVQGSVRSGKYPVGEMSVGDVSVGDVSVGGCVRR